MTTPPHAKRTSHSYLFQGGDGIRRLFAFTSVIASLLLCVTARGMDLITCDLDSLIYMGPQIVEGTLGDTHVISNFTAWNFNISAVYGAGQTIDTTTALLLLEHRTKRRVLKVGFIRKKCV